MRKFMVFFIITFLALGAIANDAYAKRFGGGSSFGKQRQSYSQQAAPRAPSQAPSAAPAPAGGNRWLGPLAGLAAGGLLASMFMGGGHGFGGGGNFMDILLILGIVAIGFMIFRAMRRAPAAQPMQYAGYNNQPAAPVPAAAGGSAAQSSSRPAWFEDEPFLRSAKGNFIRLQAAYDARDLNDIREYTTPEVFAEISLQIQERGDKAQKTDVVSLNAEVADVVTEGDLAIASVRFSGLIREEINSAAEPFNEIWHIQKSLSQPNASWFVAGIQQVA